MEDNQSHVWKQEREKAVKPDPVPDCCCYQQFIVPCGRYIQLQIMVVLKFDQTVSLLTDISTICSLRAVTYISCLNMVQVGVIPKTN